MKHLLIVVFLGLVWSPWAFAQGDYHRARLVFGGVTAATATGTSNTVDVRFYAPRTHTFQVVVTGSPASCTIDLEGSLDNSNWFSLSGNQTCTSNVMFHVTDRPVVFVRGNLSALSGGSSPTVTVDYIGVRN